MLPKQKPLNWIILAILIPLPNFAFAQSTGGPTGSAIKLKGADFQRYRNNNPGYPKVQGAVITLTPDNQYSASGVIWLKKSIPLPYKIHFEYSIYDDDGGSFRGNNSADGLVFMFAKDKRKYTAPPTGGSRGFIKDGTGFGIDLKTWGGRELRLINGHGEVLRSLPQYQIPGSPNIYTHGKWQKVAILVTRNGVQVEIAGKLALKHKMTVRGPFNGLGFGAATGGADSEHRLRKIEVTPYSPVKATKDAIARYLEVLSGSQNPHFNSLINEMGHQDYSRRKKAAQELIQSPVLPLDLLTRACRSKNLDIRLRALYILSFSSGVKTTKETTRRVLLSLCYKPVKGLTRPLVQLMTSEHSKNQQALLEKALRKTATSADLAFLQKKAKSLTAWRREIIVRVVKGLASGRND